MKQKKPKHAERKFDQEVERITAVDEDGKPVAGVTSWPNGGWWNGGSQICCHPLVRGERLLRIRDYHSAIDEAFPPPFQRVTGADGRVTLEVARYFPE